MLTIILAVLLLLAPLAHAYGAEEEVITIGSTGDLVTAVQDRLRELGYFNYRSTGKFSELSRTAVRTFQQQNGLPADGKVGNTTISALFASTAQPAQQNPKFKTVYGPIVHTPEEYGELSSWTEIDKLFPAGTTVEIFDLYSDASFSFQRTGGVNNAMIEPVSSDDADEFVYMCGGEPTWEKRPVLAEIDGVKYAASIFCTLDGTDTLPDNGATGSTVLYFNGSKSDLFSLADVQHDEAVLTAAGVNA